MWESEHKGDSQWERREELKDALQFREIKAKSYSEGLDLTHRVGSPGSSTAAAVAAAMSRCTQSWHHPSRSCCSSTRRCTVCDTALAWRRSWCGPDWMWGWPLENTHTPGWGAAVAETDWRRASSFLLRSQCDTLPIWAKGGLFKYVRVCANNWPVASCNWMTDVPQASKWGREYY